MKQVRKKNGNGLTNAQIQAGQKGLSDREINNIMEPYVHDVQTKNPSYLGCIASDEISSLIPKIMPRSRISWVMNLSPSRSDGSHWVSVYIDARPSPLGKQIIHYYDSFARPPNKAFMKHLKTVVDRLQPDGYLKFKKNDLIEQSDDSTECGYFACRALIDAYAGRHWQDITPFNDSIRGEKDIHAFKLKLGLKPFQYIRKSKQQLLGAGIIDNISQFLSGPRDFGSPSIRQFLSTQGTNPVQSLEIQRTPISKYIKMVADALSLGRFSQQTQRLHYDQLFHLSIIVNHQWRLEKNEVWSVSPYQPRDDTTSIPVSVSSGITINDLFQKAIQLVGPSKFWIYHPESANCQYGIKWMLQSNNMLTPSIDKFIMQDSTALLQGSPVLRSVFSGVTNLAGRLDVLLHGKGCE